MAQSPLTRKLIAEGCAQPASKRKSAWLRSGAALFDFLTTLAGVGLVALAFHLLGHSLSALNVAVGWALSEAYRAWRSA